MKILLSLLVLFQLHADILQDLDTYIEKERVKRNVPGVAVVVVEGDTIVFAKGYGIREVNKTDKVDDNTIFQLASVSKTFTSAGVGSLVDEGKLSWDEEVIRHLPGFTLKDVYATRYSSARDLLAHRTGLPAFQGDLLGIIGLPREEILYRIRFVEPGASFREKALYSNLGFFSAGELVAKLSNTTFEDAIKKRLLTPLDMNRTGFAELVNDANIAKPHAIINKELKAIPREDSKLFAAAGGVFSTARDLGNWMILHLNEGKFKGKSVLRPETIHEMHKPSMVADVSFTETPPITENSGYTFGLGWDSFHFQNALIVEKSGALDGVRSIVTLIPEKKRGIAIVANLNLTPLPEIIRAKYLNQVFGVEATYDKAFQDFDELIEKIFAIPKPDKALPLSHTLDSFMGVFNSEVYGNAEIKKDGDKLSLIFGPVKATLTHYSGDVFILTWPSIDYGHQKVTFTFDENGHAYKFGTETLGDFERKE